MKADQKLDFQDTELPFNNYINLSELTRIIINYRLIIFSCTLATLLGTLFYLYFKPPLFEAKIVIDVFPEYSLGARIDKDFFETRVLTQFETISSLSIIEQVREELAKDPHFNWSLEKLHRALKITRSPKTSIVIGSIKATDPDKALKILNSWQTQIFHTARQKTLNTTLLSAHTRLKELQDSWLGHVADMKSAQNEVNRLEEHKYIYVSRTLDESALRQGESHKPLNPPQDTARLQLLAQEINPEYLDARKRLAETTGKAAEITETRVFYLDIIQEIARIFQSGTHNQPQEPGNESEMRAREYLKTCIDSKTIIPLGNAVFQQISRKILFKTILFSACALALSICAAFAYEYLADAAKNKAA